MEHQRNLNLQTAQPLPLVSVIMATYMTRDRAANGHFLAQMVKQHLDRQRGTEGMPAPATKDTPLP